MTINGDSIQYASSSGSIDPTKLTPLTFNGTLAPGQHFFVEGNNNGATVDGTEPTPDVSNPNLAISKSDFTIFLTNSTTPLTSPTDPSIIDEVGAGASPDFEGALVPVLSSTTAATRNGNGCKDTNNNAADFTVVPANSATSLTIHNSMSPLAPCTPTPPPATPEISTPALLAVAAATIVGGGVILTGRRRRHPSV